MTKSTLLILLLVVLGIITFVLISKYQSPATAPEGLTTDFETSIPRHLLKAFPDTDWSRYDSSLEMALSGGPDKDGIPALENPSFISLKDSTIPDDVQTIVVSSGDITKVYPYNILTWHEIVNDTVNGVPVAVTFCPLCGSAIVFNRTLPTGEVSTFGVSGSLLESNMIMYDRSTESLWQQSTGQSLAGAQHGNSLSLETFQLLTMGEVRENYPRAQILSEETGYSRDYDRNPYAGYESNNQFIFEPSSLDPRFEPKTIMVVFYAGETPIATPWLRLKDAKQLSVTHEGKEYSLGVSDSSELSVVDEQGAVLPFYFEMWFSAATQHKENLMVLE